MSTYMIIFKSSNWLQEHSLFKATFDIWKWIQITRIQTCRFFYSASIFLFGRYEVKVWNMFNACKDWYFICRVVLFLSNMNDDLILCVGSSFYKIFQMPVTCMTVCFKSDNNTLVEAVGILLSLHIAWDFIILPLGKWEGPFDKFLWYLETVFPF